MGGFRLIEGVGLIWSPLYTGFTVPKTCVVGVAHINFYPCGAVRCGAVRCGAVRCTKSSPKINTAFFPVLFVVLIQVVQKVLKEQNQCFFMFADQNFQICN